VHQRADAEGGKHLTRPQLADLGLAHRVGGRHGRPPSSTACSPSGGGAGGGWPAISSSPPSSMMSLTLGSTSRSELRQLNSSHFSRLGWRSRLIVVPRFGPSAPPRGSEKVSVRPPVWPGASACHRASLSCSCPHQPSATA